MKRIFSLLFVLTFFVTSCQNSIDSLSGQNGNVTFRLSTDASSRSVSNSPTRYVMELYKLANSGDVVSGTPANRYVSEENTFTITLEDGVEYACLFWADFGNKDSEDNDYNVSDLKSVSIVSGKNPQNEAFGGSVRFKYDSKGNKDFLNVMLTHSVSKVNFVQTYDFVSDNNTLSVTFPRTYSFNVDTKKVTEVGKNATSTYTFNNIGKVSSGSTIGSCYLIADGTDSQTTMDISYKFNSSEAKSITNVPFQSNKTTNINGNYSNNANETLIVSCNNDWDSESLSNIKAVDLGLSVKWANCNVGASKPEDYGDYFAWGEIKGYNSGKTDFSWDTYKYNTNNKLTKYCTDSSSGTVDNKKTLELEDDAAYVNWGSSWRMPTYDEMKELKNNCTWKWITTENGVEGYKVTSNKEGFTDRSIFLPAAGSRDDSDLNSAGSCGGYWSSSLVSSATAGGYYLYFYSGYSNMSSYGRCRGYSVRPVFSK